MLCMVANCGRVARIFSGRPCCCARARRSLMAAASCSVDSGRISSSEEQVVWPCACTMYSNTQPKVEGWLAWCWRCWLSMVDALLTSRLLQSECSRVAQHQNLYNASHAEAFCAQNSGLLLPLLLLLLLNLHTVLCRRSLAVPVLTMGLSCCL